MGKNYICLINYVLKPVKFCKIMSVKRYALRDSCKITLQYCHCVTMSQQEKHTHLSSYCLHYFY